MAADQTPLDVVFLLPGFLGFERLEDYAYFGERFASALRASLMARVARPDAIEVVAIPLPPTSSLADRQLALGRTLVDRLQHMRSTEIRSVHLVGHSTGGVDAHLLTLEKALAGRSWRNFEGTDVTQLKERVRSVISFASPHQGTCLAVDPIAKLLASDSPADLLRDPLDNFQTFVKAAGEILQAVPDLFRDQELRTLLQGLTSSSGFSFFHDILQSRALIDDLSPDAMVDRYAALGKAQDGVLRRSFVTIAGATPDANKNAVRSAATRPSARTVTSRGEKLPPPGNLFMLLSQLTSGRNTPCFATGKLRGNPNTAIDLALADDARVITGNRALIPERIDNAQNDGVVNAVRQLIKPDDRDELVAIVIADHFDVVGHYDRQVWLTDPRTGEREAKTLTNGLLHSGSEFREPEFFELIRRMADAMLPAFA